MPIDRKQILSVHKEFMESRQRREFGEAIGSRGERKYEEEFIRESNKLVDKNLWVYYNKSYRKAKTGKKIEASPLREPAVAASRKETFMYNSSPSCLPERK